MLSFKQYLTELFDKPYPFKKNPSLSSRFETGYNFDTGDGVYDAIIAYTPLSLGNGTAPLDAAEISFGKEKGGSYNLMPVGSDIKNASRVYATVAEILKLAIKTGPKVDVIYFTAAHARTVPLYQRFAKQIAKQLGGT